MHQEAIEQLTHRANVLMKQAEDRQISAGRVLAELKERITNKDSDEGSRGIGSGSSSSTATSSSASRPSWTRAMATCSG